VQSKFLSNGTGRCNKEWEIMMVVVAKGYKPFGIANAAVLSAAKQ